jgi:hypothetical protein
LIGIMIDGIATVAPNTGNRAAVMGEGLAISSMLLLLVPCLTIVAGRAGAVIAALRPGPARRSGTVDHGHDHDR